MKPNTVVGREGGTDRPADRYTRYAVMDTGLITGTILLTTDGEIPVEHLSVGDKIITRDTGLSKVEHIQRSTADHVEHQGLNKRPFVNHLAARGVDQEGVLFHQAQPARVDQVAVRRAARAVQ